MVTVIRLYPLCLVPFERTDRGREAGPLLRGTKKLRLHANEFILGASLAARQYAKSRHLLTSLFKRNRHESSPRLSSC